MSLVLLPFFLAVAPFCGSPSALQVEVEVNCPELDREQSAAIEARQVGELLAAGHHSGRLSLGCSDSETFGTWQQDGFEPISSGHPRSPKKSVSEELLRLGAQLLEQERARAREREESVSEPPLPAPVVPETGVPTSPPPAATEGEVSGRLVRMVIGPAQRGKGPPIKVSAGADLSLNMYGGAGLSMLGPELWMEWTRLSWGLAPHMNYQIATRRVDSFLAREWSGSLLAVYHWTDWFALAAGPAYSVLDARSSDPLIGTKTRSVLGGAALSMRFTLGEEGVRFALELGIRLLARSRIVQLDAQQLLHLSSTQAMLRAGVHFDL